MIKAAIIIALAIIISTLIATCTWQDSIRQRAENSTQAFIKSL